MLKVLSGPHIYCILPNIGPLVYRPTMLIYSGKFARRLNVHILADLKKKVIGK